MATASRPVRPSGGVTLNKSRPPRLTRVDTPLPSGVTPEALLDTPKQNLFVVECSTPTLDAISVVPAHDVADDGVIREDQLMAMIATPSPDLAYRRRDPLGESSKTCCQQRDSLQANTCIAVCVRSQCR